MLASTIAHLESHNQSQTNNQTPISKRTRKRTYEILIIDDGSTDHTSSLALSLAHIYPQSDIRITRLVKNQGKGGAVRHAMLHARGRRLLMVDADGASRFEDLEALWDEMDELVGLGDEELGVVVGSRAHLVKTDAVVKVLYIPHPTSNVLS